MLLGSRSKKRLEEPCPPWVKPPLVLVFELNGTPSTTNKGWLEPEIEEYPLIMMFVPVPDTPEVAVMLTPGILPCKTRPTSA